MFDDMTLDDLISLRLDINKEINERRCYEYVKDHIYFTIQCPVCKRDIKEYMLEIAEKICTMFPCGSCQHFKEPFKEATRCHTCNSFHINFERKE